MAIRQLTTTRPSIDRHYYSALDLIFVYLLHIAAVLSLAYGLRFVRHA